MKTMYASHPLSNVLLWRLFDYLFREHFYYYNGVIFLVADEWSL
jgi:hypothetical protein